MTWETIYLACFGIGLAFSVLAFVGGFGHLSLGDLHLGDLHLGDVHVGDVHVGDIHAGDVHVGDIEQGHNTPSGHAGVSYFNIYALMAFLCWFGGVGFLLTIRHSFSVPLVLLLAVGSGLIAATLISAFLVKVLLPIDRPMLPQDTQMQGVIARVSSTVFVHGTGEIVFSLDGTRRCSAARAEDGLLIERDAHVQVLRYEHGIAWVRRCTGPDEAGSVHLA